ncbi:MAG: SUMF1/EgtB/PvdO family nonheme iron enzyme [Rhodospirillaceae bacterium]|nr:SUMF1/EgtB/PvdO family nonheme iron enzyme [Rhodospirillaceae bacterium]
MAGSIELAEGFGLVVGDAVYTVSRRPVLRVQSPGFREAMRAIQPGEKGRRIAVTLVPLPGRVLATTSPALDESRWSFDGRLVTVGAALDTEGEDGPHEVAVNHPFHAPATRAVELARGETTEIEIALAPIAGRLTILSDPVGATVEVDGARAGATPLDRSLKGGEYRITVTAPDRQPLEDVIRITNAKPEVARNYKLLPFAATLKFQVMPAGGELLVDGRRVSPADPLTITAAADHTVVYLRNGYQGETRTVRLGANETRTVELVLKPELGLVEFETSPAAQIYVNGALRGEGNAALRLLAVPTKIELRKPGYRSVARTIVPSAANPLVIRETLILEAVARLAEAPRAYTNSAGIELVLFEPADTYTMGAPRHEIGQRANEFERQVRLTRPFYAARHETTNGQMAMFRGSRGLAPNEPVSDVRWQDAAAFANWLSAKEGLKPFYDMTGGRLRGFDPTADGYRLLSEAEWEWLARKAGRPARSIFPWGDTATIPRGAGNIADESANGVARNFVPNYNDGHARIAPVGRFAAEKSGLFDLTGNVSEWVHDWYLLEPPAKGSVVTDPLGPSFGDSHVVKGSSWRSGTRTNLRAAYRDGLSTGRDDVGFRIGRYLHGETTAQ